MTKNTGTRLPGGAMPDMEDWWGDAQPGAKRQAQKRPRYREQTLPPTEEIPARRRTRAARRRQTQTSRLLMYAALGVVLVCLFMQVGRYAEIAAQSKRISGLISEIKRLEAEHDNLVLRLDARQNIQRVKAEAVNNLFMNYPKDGQVRPVSVAGRPLNQQTQTAAIPAQ